MRHLMVWHSQKIETIGVPTGLRCNESSVRRTHGHVIMTRDHAGHWCKWTARHPLWMEVRVRGPRCPLRNPLEKIKVKRVRGFLFFAVLAQRSVSQSSKLMMRVRFPYTARYESMPVGSSRRGSHDHVDRVRYPRLRFVRRTRGLSPAPIIPG